MPFELRGLRAEGTEVLAAGRPRADPARRSAGLRDPARADADHLRRPRVARRYVVPPLLPHGGARKLGALARRVHRAHERGQRRRAVAAAGLHLRPVGRHGPRAALPDREGPRREEGHRADARLRRHERGAAGAAVRHHHRGHGLGVGVRLGPGVGHGTRRARVVVDRQLQRRDRGRRAERLSRAGVRAAPASARRTDPPSRTSGTGGVPPSDRHRRGGIPEPRGGRTPRATATAGDARSR